MQFKIFKKQGILQGISDATFGSLRGKREAEKFLKSIGYQNIKQNQIVFAEQIFSKKVHICRDADSGKVIAGVDGLLSNLSNQILAVFTADCLPILLYDPENRVVGALHGGAKCLRKGIIKRAIQEMISCFDSNPKRILAGIGPHIRKCHYWLKKEIWRSLKDTEFKKYFDCRQKKTYFDLTKLAIADLLDCGLKKENIEDCGICTYCRFKKYFSARKRKENPLSYKKEGRPPRFASFIGLLGPEIIKISKKEKFLVEKLAKSLKKGKIALLPTDTVYGFAADATNKKAVEKIFKIKKRKLNKFLPVFVLDLEEAKKLAKINKVLGKFLKKVWPGKTTVVLKRKGKKNLYGLDKKTIALRIPNYRLLNRLLKEIKRPLSQTSANISGRPSLKKIKNIISQFSGEKYQPDLIVDAGDLPKRKPSRIIDLTEKKPKILR